jgi:hypothetical protein
MTDAQAYQMWQRQLAAYRRSRSRKQKETDHGHFVRRGSGQLPGLSQPDPAPQRRLLRLLPDGLDQAVSAVQG